MSTLRGRAINKKLALAVLCVLEAGSLVTVYALLPAPHPASVASAPLPALTMRGRRVEPGLRPTPAPSPTVLTTPLVQPTQPARPHPMPPPAPFPFQAGVNLLVYGNDPAFASKTAAQLDHLVQLHVKSVSFVFPIYQDSWTATQVHADPLMTPSMDNMRLFIRAAHQRHLRVMVRPLLDEASLHPAGKWRGSIAPSNPGAWFASYTSLVVGYAQLAQAEGAEAIDVGTEFDSLQWDSGYWLKLLNAVRRVYRGQLTYSSNWAISYPAFGWALDFLSIDAFFPLAVPASATQQQLVSAWAPWTSRASGIAYAFGKPVVFTELGTTSEVASFQQPWVWHHGTGLSLEAQRLYYAASCQAVKGRVGGMYWWEYDLQPLTSPLTDPGYNPQGKPAELEIANCYR